ncbi:hypothetical protein GCM10011609_04190 [Lentzea pudingi]|uniref:Cobalamin-independent methionine synthase MetE C-terminal/archaeal domain-containing protein n=1 Tax=Lentzea pudingi TaxID=1789439 RepID=A0ABQ2H9M5_9PSEU|nr:hypothetical protein GCM10011609_04190 [Lentzea pudingi]
MAVRVAVPGELLWINPGCGSKTRGYAEVEPALRNLVERHVARGQSRVDENATTGGIDSAPWL